MLTRHLGLGLLGFVVAAVWAYAQPQNPANSALDSSAATSLEAETAIQQANQAAGSSSTKSSTDDLDRWLRGPEIWRLPPVASTPTPSALVMPPTELVPGPSSSTLPPVANVPATLSDELSIDDPHKNHPLEPDPDKLWDGMFDLGLDGSEGNSENLSFRFGFHTNRKTTSSILTLNLDYNKNTSQTKSTVNRLFFDGRFEWLIRQSRWSWFVHETIEYDEFQAFNVRDTSDVGFGYRIAKNENTTLIGRLGGGFSHEYGGPENGEYTPEAVFGVQLEHQVSRRQKILGLVEYAPDLGDFLDYRLRLQAALEVLLDAEKNLSMRIGVLDRYTSNPNGARPNDLDYALVLLWKF